ncbi:AAA family ATPase, partial [Vibrio parahaemolyticus]
MYISQLSIVNFKNFERSNFYFEKDSVNTVIGENASGKTNAFQAMRLILDDSLPANSKFLSADDFHRGIGEPFGHWVVITLYFEGLTDSEEQQVLSNYILNDEGKKVDSSNGTYSFIYRPKFSIRQDLYELTCKHDDKIARSEAIQGYIKSKAITRDTYEPVAFVRTKLDFTDDNTYKATVGDFDEYKFPDPSKEN